MKNFETKKFFVVGNNLALNFINSVMFEVAAENLAAWAMAVGLVETDNARQLCSGWNEDDLAGISEFRSRLRAIVEKLGKTGDIEPGDIDLINSVLSQSGRVVELTRAATGFDKRLKIDLADAQKILVPIAESFVDLLCYGNHDYLRKCENPECVLYFYDTTKNHRRRWCSMAVCGNRAKANKFYQKKKLAA